MVLAMVKDLPEGSRLTARTYGKRPPIEPNSEIDWYLERREWGSTDRMLAAAQVNLLGDLLRFVPMWEKGKGPKPAPVGPPEWRGIKPETEEKKREASIEDAMRVFGWPG
jgi:hypothetical protein